MTSPAAYNDASTKPSEPGYYVGKTGFGSPRLWWDGEQWHTVKMVRKVYVIAKTPAKNQDLKWRKLEIA